MGFIQEFKEFALKGNVMDMAVGVIIGGAFGKIVNSVINDLIMPVVGMANNANFTDYYIGLTGPAREAASLAEAKKASLPVLTYGNFATEVVNFLILAFCVFLMVKAINMAKSRFETQQAAAPPPAPAADVVLLTEIRDLLKSK